MQAKQGWTEEDERPAAAQSGSYLQCSAHQRG
jgi:hypothetical protein